MLHVIKLLSESTVLTVKLLLLSSLSIDVDVHLTDLICELSHHLIILCALVFQADVSPIHIADLVIKRSNSMLHITQLVSQPTILSIDVAQSIDLNFDIIKLASPAEVRVLLPIGLIELLSQNLNLVLSSISAIVLN